MYKNLILSLSLATVIVFASSAYATEDGEPGTAYVLVNVYSSGTRIMNTNWQAGMSAKPGHEDSGFFIYMTGTQSSSTSYISLYGYDATDGNVFSCTVKPTDAFYSRFRRILSDYKEGYRLSISSDENGRCFYISNTYINYNS